MEENEYKKRNILIDYTKWLLKWIVILGVGFGILLAVFLWSQDYLKERKDRLVDVFAIECDAPEEWPEERGFDKLHYLGKKKASDDVPSRLHRPAYDYGMTLSNSTSVRDTYEQYNNVDVSQEAYLYYQIDPSPLLIGNPSVEERREGDIVLTSERISKSRRMQLLRAKPGDVVREVKSSHKINRESGEVTYTEDVEAKDPKSEVWENCQIITPDEFYKRTGKILKALQEKIKI